MGVFLKVLGEDARSFVPWVLWATISLAVAVSGPFGSYGAMTLGGRAAFWSPAIGLGIIVASVIRAFVYGTLGLHGTLRGTLLSAALNCLVLCPAFYLLVYTLVPPIYASGTKIGEIILLVASISLGICALRHADPLEAVPLVEASPIVPRLMRRIEPALQGDIWAITVRDHYVDVQTSRGKVSLLMRFSDAIEEVNCLAGAQVHRSHWVAWSGVGSVCRDGGKVNLHLKNGHQIPVSRNHRDKVDAWFPPMPVAKDIAA